METPSTRSATPAKPASADDAKASRPAPVSATFAEMYLKVGDKIQIEIPLGVTVERTAGKVIGWAEDSSFLVSLPQRIVTSGLLKENILLLLRVFNGRSAFAFHTTVFKIVHFPFMLTYLHLRFPDKIEAVAVRASFRHSVHFPVTIAVAGKAGIAGQILNIGMNGARISTTEPLNKYQGLIRLATQFDLYSVPAPIPVLFEASAQVRNSKDATDERGVTQYEYGMEFKELQPNDQLVLGNLLWYQMQMHPEST